jgi:hypothetical protein
MGADYVVRHGAPTLAGLKTGNLFPCSFPSFDAMAADLREANRVLVPRGLRLLPLRQKGDKTLLYLFRPDYLAQDLAHRDAQVLLAQAGYPSCDRRDCLRELTRRLRANEDFPHEIGLFLGYPPEDVAGFVRHGGKGCKCVGCWKVYGDEAAAQARFAAYHRCTEHLCRRMAQGCSLADVTTLTQ